MNADSGYFHFHLFGSKTGPDGNGLSDHEFVSTSGRVVIEPQDWWVTDVQKKPLISVGSQITWSVLSEFADTYSAPVVTDPSKEYATMIAQGLSNGKHVLTLMSA